ncbi:MAG TPA: hypothetical protein VFK97_01630, partial [Candidatus Saccharimonadales bacterium]|nr:hypothetical protein [Candidatus Saccharimonadales bacterium]
DPSTGSNRCQFYTTGPTTVSGAVNIPAGYQVTLYINGSVTISGNITYAGPTGKFNPTNRANIPYFAIVTKGNIYLTNSVTRLDGLYVAQPSPTAAGKFETCDSPDIQSTSQCTNQLTINGAVVAQYVELLRSHGSSQPLGCNPRCDINGIGTAPAEIINFVPSMILGAPGFSALPNSPQGLVSLPPVF